MTPKIPININDITLITAFLSIILILTAESIRAHPNRKNIVLNKKPIKKIGFILGLLFIVTIIITLARYLILE
jgi:hypothetical protein